MSTRCLIPPTSSNRCSDRSLVHDRAEAVQSAACAPGWTEARVSEANQRSPLNEVGGPVAVGGVGGSGSGSSPRWCRASVIGSEPISHERRMMVLFRAVQAPGLLPGRARPRPGRPPVGPGLRRRVRPGADRAPGTPVGGAPHGPGQSLAAGQRWPRGAQAGGPPDPAPCSKTAPAEEGLRWCIARSMGLEGAEHAPLPSHPL